MVCLYACLCLQDNWLCPDCAAGKPPPKRAATSSRDLFLQQAGLGLGRVEALWEEGGTQQALVRWYEVPEQLHCGRQVRSKFRI